MSSNPIPAVLAVGCISEPVMRTCLTKEHPHCLTMCLQLGRRQRCLAGVFPAAGHGLLRKGSDATGMRKVRPLARVWRAGRLRAHQLGGSHARRVVNPDMSQMRLNLFTSVAGWNFCETCKILKMTKCNHKGGLRRICMARMIADSCPLRLVDRGVILYAPES